MIFKAKRDLENKREFEFNHLTIDELADFQDGLKYNEDGSLSNWNKSLIKIARKKVVKISGFKSDSLSDEILIEAYGNALNAMNVLIEFGAHIIKVAKPSEEEVKN